MSEVLTPIQRVHLYVLLMRDNEHKYNYKSAVQIVTNSAFKELNKITCAEVPIDVAIKEIKANVLKIKGVKLNNSKLIPSQEVYDAIIKVLAKIHDYCVAANLKHDNGNANSLFLYLPIALIGIEEIAKDLVYIALIVKKLGISLGKMQLKSEGVFVPNQDFVNAYNRYVMQWKEKRGFNFKQDLSKHLNKCVDGKRLFKIYS